MTYEDNLVTEEKIRERAYLLWEEAGRPDGSGENFWLQAEKQIEEEQYFDSMILAEVQSWYEKDKVYY